MKFFFQKMRAVWRLLIFFFSALAFIAAVLAGTFFASKKVETGLRIRAAYARFLCRFFGIEVKKSGYAPSGPCLFVAAAHRSYFDPVVICSFVPAKPIAKAELADWPLIGYGCRVSGVILVKREDPTSRREALAAVGEAILTEKVQALIFAEGTTHGEPFCLELRSGGFRLAAKMGIAVVPVALDYDSELAHFVGKDTFLPHFLRCFGQKRQRAFVRFGEPMISDDPDFLKRETQIFIDRSLADFRLFE